MSRFLMDFPDDQRKRLIAKIHVAKKQLGLDEDVYRGVLEGVTGKVSCSAMDVPELNRVMTYLRSKGFKESLPAKKSLSPASKNRPVKTPQTKAIALWITLWKSGIVRDRSHEALGAFVQRMLGKKLKVLPGVDPLDAATPQQMSAVIESLKEMQERGHE